MTQHSSFLRESEHIKSFDGIRALAVILVVLGHVFDMFPRIAPHSQIAEAILGNAPLGVRIFFVLSGYLITGLLLREFSTVGTISVRRFMMRRAVRILPAFYGYLIALALLNNFRMVDFATSEFLSGATFTWNYSGLLLRSHTSDGTWFFGHLWSLAMEEQFYLLWPWCCLLYPIFRLRPFTLLAVCTFPFIRVASYYAFPQTRGLITMMFHSGADPIFMGFAIALYRVQALRILHIVAKRLWFQLLVVVVPTIISPIMTVLFHGGYSVTIGITIDSVLIAILILCIHSEFIPTGLLSTLQHPLLRWIGRLSYSIYLWQQLFLMPTLFRFTLEWRITLILCTAVLSYYCIERPFLRLKSRFAPLYRYPKNTTTTPA